MIKYLSLPVFIIVFSVINYVLRVRLKMFESHYSRTIAACYAFIVVLFMGRTVETGIAKASSLIPYLIWAFVVLASIVLLACLIAFLIRNKERCSRWSSDKIKSTPSNLNNIRRVFKSTGFLKKENYECK